tara:strand:+ start:72 stop:563 length:492 start_codon:yes stop_codon:yes gene_type:complete
MIFRILFSSIFIFLSSCTNISFLYDESKNITNPLYNKTNISYSGKEISTITKYTGKYFGSSGSPKYNLDIEILEEKKKISVQSNQAVSKEDYKLQFNYILRNIKDDCNLYEKVITSRFSYTPKSSGYNFGSDQSLEKMYELAVDNNLQQFINILSNLSLNDCT